jgi:hypothetical protein
MIEAELAQIFERHEAPKPAPKNIPHTFMCDQMLKDLIVKAAKDLGKEATADVIRKSVAESLRGALEFKQNRSAHP